MKKLFLLILITLFTIGTNAQSSETEFRFENFEIGRYYKVKISFGGEYNKNYWQFKSDNQYIYFTQDDLDKATIEFEKAFNKAIEWDKVADENNVDKLNKKMDFSFKTTRGMLEDAGYESVGSFNSKFQFIRTQSSGKTSSEMRCDIYQHDEYVVRSAFFKFPAINVRDESHVQAFNKFLTFLKNSKTLVLERIAKEKEKTKVFN